MCDLSSLNKDQDHMRREFSARWEDFGNLPPLPGIVPDMMAPVIRNDGRRDRSGRDEHPQRRLAALARLLATSFPGPTDAPSPATGKTPGSALLKKLEVALWHF